MNLDNISRINLIIQTVVIAAIIIHTSMIIHRSGKRSMRAAYFIFGCISYLMSNLYWVVYVFIEPDNRMPFAANEFGESATFLLFSMVLILTFQGVFADTRREVVLTVIFTAANAALWIAWSGEWVQDIVGGILFGYYLCAVVRSMKQAGVMSRREWTGVGIGAYLVVVLQGIIFFVPAEPAGFLDKAVYCLLYAGILFFFRKTIRAFRRNSGADEQLCFSFAGNAWLVVSLYMSAEPIYQVTNFLITLMLLFMMKAVENKVGEA